MFSPTEWIAIVLSLKIALVAMLVSIVPAVVTAHLLARFRFPGKALLDVCVHLPLVLPPVVTGFALLLLLGRQGPLGGILDRCCGIVFAFRWTGAVVAAMVMAFPLFVRAVRLSIEAIDIKVEIAAATLGASPMRVFMTVTLPLAFEGIIAGMVLTFAKALGEFGATMTFVANIPGETQTIATAIYTDLSIPGGGGDAMRLSGLSIVLAMVALALAEYLAYRQRRRLQ